MSAVILASLAVVAAGIVTYARTALLAPAPSSNPSSPTDAVWRTTTAAAAATTAYILENTVTHARRLPAASAHAFAYPTLALLLPLRALERRALDLGRGWVFGYGGGGAAARLTGLRSGAYLLPDGAVDCDSRSGGAEGESERRREAGPSLRAKLAAVLEMHGREGARVRAWAAGGDAWMLTMPSYVGFEGINPLTVYFCYDAPGALAWVVLEIHNTFGEKHVHVLEPGADEDAQEDCPPGFDHTWTFARDFHVSPFNDRSGFYTISVAVPPAPHSPALLAAPPRPKIRIHLHTASASASSPAAKPALGPLKLTAGLYTRRAVPLTTPNLLRALARYPFALLLSFARILYHAWILHYVKRLDVFPRPDPKPAARGWGSVPGHSAVHGGVGWQPEGALEAYARRVVERFLARRADELALGITLVSGDPSVPTLVFSPTSKRADGKAPSELTIHYAAPRFFSTLLLAPSPEHMLLLGRAEDLFHANSESLFSQVFAPGQSASRGSYTQRIRTYLLPQTLLDSTRPSVVPPTHPLDGDRPFVNALAVSTMHLLDNLERVVFTSLKARFVPGLEPWNRWERAAAASHRDLQ
ncbi:hypothetical protein BD413DRAFT_610350 [Trametes elegans]|nr:hypothetical protein BD413DRAFT_610350 [Trametes elegans]